MDTAFLTNVLGCVVVAAAGASGVPAEIGPIFAEEAVERFGVTGLGVLDECCVVWFRRVVRGLDRGRCFEG